MLYEIGLIVIKIGLLVMIIGLLLAVHELSDLREEHTTLVKKVERLEKMQKAPTPVLKRNGDL